MINSSEIDMGTKRVAFRFPGEPVDIVETSRYIHVHALVFVDRNNRISRPEHFTDLVPMTHMTQKSTAVNYM